MNSQGCETGTINSLHSDIQSSVIEVNLNKNQQNLSKVDEQVDSFEELDKNVGRLRKFIDGLGERATKNISRQTLKQFCSDPNKFKCIDGQFVLLEVQKRVDKMRKNKRMKRNWSVNDFKIMIWLICMLVQSQNLTAIDVQNDIQFWKIVSSMIPATTAQSCLFKWLGERKYRISVFGWNQEEQRLLIELQKKNSLVKNKWKHVSQQLYLVNNDKQKIFRQAKQCRQHYMSFLNPSMMRGIWSKEQDILLMSDIVLNGGHKKWCKLVNILKGRTQNAIKNRYQLIYSKLIRRKENKMKKQNQIIVEFLKENDPNFERFPTTLQKKENKEQNLTDNKKEQKIEYIKCQIKAQSMQQNQAKINESQQQQKFQRINQAVKIQKQAITQKFSVVKEEYDSEQNWNNYIRKEVMTADVWKQNVGMQAQDEGNKQDEGNYVWSKSLDDRGMNEREVDRMEIFIRPSEFRCGGLFEVKIEDDY